VAAANPDCPYIQDLVMWDNATMSGDGEAMASMIGDYEGHSCPKGTLQILKDGSPTGAGMCELVAYSKDNPGYDTTAANPPRPRKPILADGPGC
jgi:hypothetical protein